MAETADRDRRKVLEALEPGQVCKGVVSSIEGFGAFVDIGGFDGLVNVAELSWAHVDAVSDVVEVGQEVAIVVLGVDMEREQASLSLKALCPDPLEEFARGQFGRVIPGRVERVVRIGAFVMLHENFAGLVPIHELAARDADEPESVLQHGDEVMVEVVDINLYRRRILLSLRS
ncbi:S1 RNA-binding domain-containing protein [Streptomyces sp. YC504]|uniref:S1 RNA-binding domain-containing protein n=1 Tax=Streptomyces mesophilus TaxID=1775132 RepID=A0A6G4XRV6_9ACTN|nr:S1 RNA-binding domain-containing protein [Streptomyces mesophilus]NGO80295.1 S1 RNA-binding domain-containing protein [Streptomyces mesophilus]